MCIQVCVCVGKCVFFYLCVYVRTILCSSQGRFVDVRGSAILEQGFSPYVSINDIQIFKLKINANILAECCVATRIPGENSG